jgi:hypothetical protein
MEKEENNQLAFFDEPLKRGYLLDDWKRARGGGLYPAVLHFTLLLLLLEKAY